MESDAIQKELLTKAGRLLARRPYSRGELQAKLAKIAPTSEIEAALDTLEALNLLNDADYAYNFALDRIRLQGWGPIRIRHSLLHRQVASQTVEAAIERVNLEEGYTFVLRAYLKRRCRRIGLPANRKELQKLIGHLRRHGFTDTDIFEVLHEMVPEDVWTCFETGD